MKSIDMAVVLESMTFEFFATGRHKIDLEELFTKDNALFLDVRSYYEVESLQLHLKYYTDVLHIPIDELPRRISDIPRDRTIGIFCSAGIRAAIVYAFLRSRGYENVYIITGGYDAVVKHVLPKKLFKKLGLNKSSERE